jgi:hypothetical protein
METCPGCGLRLPPAEGATDPYGGASPACWAIFGEVLARDFGEYRYPAAHRLVVDAYLAQHPGFATAAGRRSVAVHLVGLHCVLDKGMAGDELRRTLAGVFPDKRDILPFEPVPRLDAVNVAFVHAARDVEEHAERAKVWATAVWQAWAPHHPRVLQLLPRRHG